MENLKILNGYIKKYPNNNEMVIQNKFPYDEKTFANSAINGNL